MFDFIIILSRYLFLIYLGYFLLEGGLFIMGERGILKINCPRCVSRQRVVIVFIHLTAFLILAYIPETYTFDSYILALAALGLAFQLIGQFLVDKFYKNGCPLMWNAVFCLLDIGFIMLVRLNTDYAQRQLLWFLVSLSLMLLIPVFLAFIPQFEKLEIIYLIFSFALIVSPFIIGTRTYGALNWISFMGMSFQPSEIVKFLYIFYLASVFRKKLNFKQVLFPIGISVMYVCILVLQRDLGGALIFFMTFMVVFYISTGNFIFTALGLIITSAASYGAYLVFPHIKIRVIAWQNPWQDMNGAGYQVIRSLFSILTFGALGSGLTRGMPHTVPVVESDFIYSAICEEFGAFFGIGMIFVYILIFYRGVHIALRCGRRYYSLLAAGFTSMLAFQTFLIIGGVTKLVPLTGVTLPFVSYGGSSILVCTLMVGILQWVYIFNKSENRDDA